METSRSTTGVGVSLLISVFLTILAVSPTWGQPSAAPAAPTKPNPILLTQQVERGGTLTIYDEQGLFDNQSAVTFALPQGDHRDEAPIARSNDGKVVMVHVPPRAVSGTITIKQGNTETKRPLEMVNIFEADYWWLYQIIYFLMALIPVFFFVIFLFWIFGVLKKDGSWRLGEALSEQIEDKSVLMIGDNPVLKDNKEPVYVLRTIYTNSSSRLIAFIGLFAIIAWVLAILMPAVYRYASTGEIPDLSNFTKFILAQAGIFTPYIVAKITYIFTKPTIAQ